MAVAASTIETYDNSLIREDLQEAYSMISPEECPLQQLAGGGSVSSTLKEWPIVELQDPDPDNRVVEGDDDVENDDPTLGDRVGNYTQISDKVAQVSHTSQAVDAAAKNIQRLANQITLKMKEMKRDKEVMLLSNVPALPAASGSPRQTAGLPAWIKTNTAAGAGGTEPTLSGTTEGIPNAAAGVGTPTDLTELMLNDVIEKCWNSGAEPSIIMVNGGNKRTISATFTGNSTRYKDSIDKKLVAAIDIYDSDFGELTVVPNRFMPSNDPAGGDTSFNVFVLDPEYINILYLDEVQQKPLAETGHSLRTLVWCEYMLQVENEAALGIIRDTNNVAITA